MYILANKFDVFRAELPVACGCTGSILPTSLHIAGHTGLAGLYCGYFLVIHCCCFDCYRDFLVFSYDCFFGF